MQSLLVATVLVFAGYIGQESTHSDSCEQGKCTPAKTSNCVICLVRGTGMLVAPVHIDLTVTVQVGNIENEYRVFQMDVIAGKPQLETEVKQHTARFKLDYSQVSLHRLCIALSAVCCSLAPALHG